MRQKLVSRTLCPRVALLLACIVLVISACGDATGKGEPPLIVSPAGPLDIFVGDTLTLRASVAEGVTDFVFASSQPEIASVTQEGLVTALAPGEARITIASQGDWRVAAIIIARVGSRGPASLVFESLLNEGGLPVTPGRVAGVVFARVNIQRGDASRLEVLLGGEVACAQVFSGAAVSMQGERASLSANPPVADCPVDTAEFDPATGTPRFFNAHLSLSARLVRIDGRTLATAIFPSVTLVNQSRLVTSVTPSREAADRLGRVWAGGDLTVRALPVLYEDGIRLRQVNFLYAPPRSRAYALADSVAPFEVHLPADSLRSLLDEGLQVHVTSVTNRFAPGPESRTPPIRYDGRPPTPGTFLSREWIGANTEFASLYLPPQLDDVGVGGVVVRFYAGDPGLSVREVVERNPSVVRGADLPQASVGAYRLVVAACNALQNCVTRGGFLFGVDVTPPGLEEIGIGNRAINPEGNLAVRAQDDLSGMTSTPLEVSVSALLAGLAQPLCGPVVEGVALPGRMRGGACVPDTTGLVLPVPQEEAGYYTYRIRAVDRAGNPSPVTERMILVDRTPPVLNSFVVPSQFVPGEEAILSAEVVDNLDLAEVSFRFGFPGSGAKPRQALPFVPALQAGTPFGGALTRSMTAIGRGPFVRTLTYTTTGSVVRSTVLVDSLFVRADDAARLRVEAGASISPASFGGNVSVADPFSGVATVLPLMNTQRLCTARCNPGDPASVNVTTRIAGEPGLSPFRRMYLFLLGADGTVTQVGSTPTFSVTETGMQRTYSYTVVYTPPVGVTGSGTLFGVALNAAGNALRTDDLPIEFFTR